MRVSERGHMRPVPRRPLSATEQRRLLEACPGATLTGPERTRATDPLWGPVLALHRAHANDPELRFRGSSGGAISAVLAHLLQSGQADFVLQVAAVPGAPLDNAAQISLAVTDLLDRTGSRYGPAAPLVDFDAMLRPGHRFAVVGKPCDIAALRAYGRRRPEVSRCVGWMISFFCAGVPSLRGTQRLLRRLGLTEAEVAGLRYRGHGWPGAMTVETHDGLTHRLSYAESWGTELHRHLQFRCKICPDGTGETADLVGADAWITADGGPSFDERDGWSAVIARTPVGLALLRACADAGVLTLAPLSQTELIKMQPYQVARKRGALARLAALAIMARPRPRYRRLRLWRNALDASPAAFLRNFAGTAWRIAQGRHRE